MNKKTILLKFSGAAIKDDANHQIIDPNKIKNLVKQIQKIKDQYNIGIVIGGGNIWRGKFSSNEKINEYNSHYMGMLSTIINAIAFKEFLIQAGMDTVIFSSLPCPKVAYDHNIEKIKKCLSKGKIAIFAAGTGMPYFTTDTGAAVRAKEIGADLILMGKDGVDGIFDKDPKKYSDAKRFEQVSYEQIINNNIEVMDLTATTFSKENQIKMIVFNLKEEDSIVKALDGKIKVTKVGW